MRNNFIGGHTMQFSHWAQCCTVYSGLYSFTDCNLLNIAFCKLQHVVPRLNIRGIERELRQTKIGDSWNAAWTTVGASLETRRSTVILHATNIRYPSSSWATPACATLGALGRTISSLGFQVGHVDPLVNPSVISSNLSKQTCLFALCAFFCSSRESESIRP